MWAPSRRSLRHSRARLRASAPTRRRQGHALAQKQHSWPNTDPHPHPYPCPDTGHSPSTSTARFSPPLPPFTVGGGLRQEPAAAEAAGREDLDRSRCAGPRLYLAHVRLHAGAAHAHPHNRLSNAQMQSPLLTPLHPSAHTPPQFPLYTLCAAPSLSQPCPRHIRCSCVLLDGCWVAGWP